MRQIVRQLPRPGSWPLRSRCVAALALGLLAGCSSLESNRWTNVFLPYRIEVVQGNVVTSEQIDRLREDDAY